MAKSSLGPVLSATLVTSDLEQSIGAYCDFLHQNVQSQGVVGDELVALWGRPALTGAPMAWLANELGEAWLQLIQIEDAPVVDPFRHKGWMSLEIGVEDVDSLRHGLGSSPFEIIGEPANLDVSDDIRAMQVIGPAGEVLYLTEVKAEVPPFELPFARCAVDRLFIPVLLVDERDSALAVYEQFPGTLGLKFDTKITVINRARGYDIGHKHPVSTIQLQGQHLIEIDQLEGLAPRPRQPGQLAAGIVKIAFEVTTIPSQLSSTTLTEGLYSGHRTALFEGAAGEWIQLIETDS